MATAAAELVIERDAPIPTWFGVGGRARRLARPGSIEELRVCVQMDPDLRVLGDGANLLVGDEGVDELVVVLDRGGFSRVDRDPSTGRTVAGAGASLPRLITDSVRLGLAGLEGLGGIPASVGGAVVMNAGGAFGQIADAVVRVHALDRLGNSVSLDREGIGFSYRHSGLGERILTSVEFGLSQADPATLRERFKRVMDYKKGSQPLADRSAGCVFKNPTLARETPGIGPAGARVSAGMLIDRAGCKGMRTGGGAASVSERHANFIVADPASATAGHVLELMAAVSRRVNETFGVVLEPEIVVWRRGA